MMGAMSSEPHDHDALEALLDFDRAHVWHPYSSALTPQDPYVVESARGRAPRPPRPRRHPT